MDPRFVWIVLLALASMGTLAADAATSPVDALLEEATMLLEEGHYGEAARAYKRANKKAGGSSADCLIGLAVASNRAGDHKQALRSTEALLELVEQPERLALIRIEQGDALMGQARGSGRRRPLLERAEQAFRQAVESGTDQATRGRYRLGELLMMRERIAEGRPLLERALADAPESPYASRARQLLERPYCATTSCLPEFSSVTVDGSAFDTRDLRGRVLLLDFWATWCPPCVDSIPHLRTLAERSEREPFVVVGISVDSDADALRTFLDEHDVAWPTLHDDGAAVTHGLFNVRNFPTYMVVDHRGVIVYRASGWNASIANRIDREIFDAVAAARKASGNAR